MPRKAPVAEIQAEEATKVSSPMRRSTRLSISNSPAVATGRIATRRASAQDSDSASKNNGLSEQNDNVKQTRATRSNSKSPSTVSTESEAPAKPRTRRNSATKVMESEKNSPAISSIPQGVTTRRRSLRSASISPTNSPVKAEPAKPRGRRVSITEKVVPMEAIEETDSKSAPAPAKRTRRQASTSQLEQIDESKVADDKETKSTTTQKSSSPMEPVEDKNKISDEKQALEVIAETSLVEEETQQSNPSQDNIDSNKVNAKSSHLEKETNEIETPIPEASTPNEEKKNALTSTESIATIDMINSKSIDENDTIDSDNSFQLQIDIDKVNSTNSISPSSDKENSRSINITSDGRTPKKKSNLTGKTESAQSPKLFPSVVLSPTDKNLSSESKLKQECVIRVPKITQNDISSNVHIKLHRLELSPKADGSSTTSNTLNKSVDKEKEAPSINTKNETQNKVESDLKLNSTNEKMESNFVKGTEESDTNNANTSGELDNTQELLEAAENLNKDSSTNTKKSPVVNNKRLSNSSKADSEERSTVATESDIHSQKESPNKIQNETNSEEVTQEITENGLSPKSKGKSPKKSISPRKIFGEPNKNPSPVVDQSISNSTTLEISLINDTTDQSETVINKEDEDRLLDSSDSVDGCSDIQKSFDNENLKLNDTNSNKSPQTSKLEQDQAKESNISNSPSRSKALLNQEKYENLISPLSSSPKEAGKNETPQKKEQDATKSADDNLSSSLAEETSMVENDEDQSINDSGAGLKDVILGNKSFASDTTDDDFKPDTSKNDEEEENENSILDDTNIDESELQAIASSPNTSLREGKTRSVKSNLAEIRERTTTEDDSDHINVVDDEPTTEITESGVNESINNSITSVKDVILGNVTLPSDTSDDDFVLSDSKIDGHEESESEEDVEVVIDEDEIAALDPSLNTSLPKRNTSKSSLNEKPEQNVSPKEKSSHEKNLSTEITESGINESINNSVTSVKDVILGNVALPSDTSDDDFVLSDSKINGDEESESEEDIEIVIDQDEIAALDPSLNTSLPKRNTSKISLSPKSSLNEKPKQNVSPKEKLSPEKNQRSPNKLEESNYESDSDKSTNSLTKEVLGNETLVSDSEDEDYKPNNSQADEEDDTDQDESIIDKDEIDALNTSLGKSPLKRQSRRLAKVVTNSPAENDEGLRKTSRSSINRKSLTKKATPNKLENSANEIQSKQETSELGDKSPKKNKQNGPKASSPNKVANSDNEISSEDEEELNEKLENLSVLLKKIVADKSLASETSDEDYSPDEHTEDDEESLNSISEKSNEEDEYEDSFIDDAEIEQINSSLKKSGPKNRTRRSTYKINARSTEIENDSRSDNDSSSEISVQDFLDIEAVEGREDTPSEDSNDIPYDGESIHSESTSASDESNSDDGSFINDDEVFELLSGDEYDLSDSDKQKSSKKKPRGSRIITINDSSEEEPIDLNTSLKPLNEKDNLKSLEELKSEKEHNRSSGVDKSTTPETRRTEVNAKTPPNSSESANTSGRKRKSSLVIAETLNVHDLEGDKVSKKLSQVLNVFCSGIKDEESSGNVSLNVSLNYSPEQKRTNQLTKESVKKLKSPKRLSSDKLGDGNSEEPPSKKIKSPKNKNSNDLESSANKKRTEKHIRTSLDEKKKIKSQNSPNVSKYEDKNPNKANLTKRLERGSHISISSVSDNETSHNKKNLESISGDVQVVEKEAGTSSTSKIEVKDYFEKESAFAVYKRQKEEKISKKKSKNNKESLSSSDFNISSLCDSDDVTSNNQNSNLEKKSKKATTNVDIPTSSHVKIAKKLKQREEPKLKFPQYEDFQQHLSEGESLPKKMKMEENTVRQKLRKSTSLESMKDQNLKDKQVKRKKPTSSNKAGGWQEENIKSIKPTQSNKLKSGTEDFRRNMLFSSGRVKRTTPVVWKKEKL